jgi:hypothetical protein
MRRTLSGWIAMLGLCLAVTIGFQARSADLKSVLMPGQVVKSHSKFESDCASCHQAFDKNAQPKLCMSCHKDVASDISSSRGFHGRASAKTCKTCHTDHKGRGASIAAFDQKSFRHTQTDFELLGAHKTAACTGCHAPAKKFRDAPSSCIGCHRKDDTHLGVFGTDCAKCHGPSDWAKTTFNHADTGFILRGKHAAAACSSCHAKPAAQAKLGRDCIACHRSDDVHKGQMGTSCSNCHEETSWKQTRFDHGKTRFPLIGKHAQTDCSGCHRQANVFKGTPMDCAGCHKAKDVHQGTLGTNCQQCHQPQAWKPSRGFDHSRTRFPLIGKHREAACSGCHKAPTQFHGLAGACIDCHRKDDPHEGKNGVECASCHNATSWKTTSFDHSRMTKFPLVGGHSTLRCQSCHKGDLHKDKLDMRCVSCHAKQDVHRGKLGAECQRCHVAKAWIEVNFDHSSTTFPLLGRHQLAACSTCHADKAFKSTPTRCEACHRKDDVHEGRLGSACETCHNPRAWSLWDFDHSKQTRFALEGAHKTIKCETCHTSVQVGRVALPQTCGACHKGDDIHSGSFGMRCERCHSTVSFKALKTTK